MHRWEACAGSLRKSVGLPNISSPYAQLGTAAHEAGAEILLGDTLLEEILPDEMLRAVMVYVNHVRELSKSVKKDSGFVKVEWRFDLSDTLYDGVYGTTDAVIWNEATRVLYVVDYKHGEGVGVPVFENEQLMYYALGTLRTLKINPLAVVLVIVQPRYPHPEGPIQSWEIHPIDLIDFEVRLINAIKATEKPDAPLTAGTHCQFCPAKGICEVYERSEFKTFRRAPKASDPQDDFDEISNES